MDLPDPARHTAYSDPGKHAHRLRELPADVDALCAASRNVVVHYRAQLKDFSQDRLPEVNSRWVEQILDHDQRRFGTPLVQDRPLTQRVAGCCRDHSLLVVAMLRERGVPARTRVGFASYLVPGWAIDHVIVEYHDGRGWIRADPELAVGDRPGLDPRDLGADADSPFQSAARAWVDFRSGRTDLANHAVFPGAEGELAGVDLVRRYVQMQLAHRYGDELLLWDAWGATTPDVADVSDEEVDRVARMLVALDDVQAVEHELDRELYALYRSDPRWHPGTSVVQFSPLGEGHEVVSLARG